jgi:citrate synthase
VLKQGPQAERLGRDPAVLLGAGFPVQRSRACRSWPARAGLIAHLYEEIRQPIGFALSYQATREMEYDGALRRLRHANEARP